MFRKTLLARALMVAFGTAALAVGVSEPVMAQSNASGHIFGKVDGGAGATINITNLETGLKGKATPGSDGRYSITALPPGRYKVELVKGGAVINTQEIEVLVSQGTEASFDGAQTVQIKSKRNKIDVSNTNNGATFTAKTLKALPIAPNVDAIIQLAPNTTKADSRYPGGASFGGSAPSENAYYINGFPVTNPLSQLGGSELPFGSISQADILTGGYGAEFGRSIGGVVNITTKSGTNNWEVGASYQITPSSLRNKFRDFYYGRTGDSRNTATDNTLDLRREDNSLTTTVTGAYVGGPLIKDKLFMFVSAESTNRKSSGVRITRRNSVDTDTGWYTRSDETTRYLGKFDWNITDNHRLELSLVGDDAKRDEKRYAYSYATRQVGNVPNFSGHYQNTDTDNSGVGANLNILKYTGNLTDKLTVTTLYGESLSKHKNTFDGADVNSTLYGVSVDPDAGVPGRVYTNPQQGAPAVVLAPGAQDKIKSFRFDLELKLDKHTIRGGFDNNKLISKNAGQFTPGGGAWVYHRDDPTTPIQLGSAPDPVVIASGGGFGTQGYYVEKQLFTTSTNAGSDQSAQYIEDRFQVTKNVLVTFGLRNESFKNKNGDGVVFLEQKNQLAPRLAASWDINGDASFKVFGSAGRYSVQIPTNVSIRGASRSTNYSQFYTYSGVDANGQPTGLVELTPPASSNNEYGQAKDPLVVAAQNLKPNFQDEITFGLEKNLTPSLNFGTKVTYRKLKSTIDDFCDGRVFNAWAARNNVDTSNWRGFGCAIFNPGVDNTFLVDFNDAGPNAGKNHTVVHLTKEELGFDTAKRSYFAVDFFLEHPFRDQWYGKVNYTWSRNRGNTEGQTLSDVGQTNVSITQNFDHKEIDYYANGLLPGDRTHVIKAFGYYEFTPEWTVGGNFAAISGRPKECLGNFPNSLDPTVQPIGYGSSYHFCNDRPSPRGALGKLPWDIQLDLNVVYRPAKLPGMSFKVDVFNVFDKQTPLNVEETYNFNASGRINPRYNEPLSYTAPRAVRLTAEYSKKF